MLKSVSRIKEFIPGESLYLEVRAGFVAQGTTLTGWCKVHGIHQTSARLALRGGWTGPKSKDLCAKLIKASGARLRQHRAA